MRIEQIEGMLAETSGWSVTFTDPAWEELIAMARSGVARQVVAAMVKVKRNPLPKQEGGYGNPCHDEEGAELAGCCYIKLRDAGVRIIYLLEKDEVKVLKVLAVGKREDKEVYREAARRLRQYRED